MKTSIRAAAVAAALPMLCVGAAAAQTATATSKDGRHYLSLSVGAVAPTEFEYDITGGDVKVETDTGLGATLAYGYAFNPHLRGEINASYFEADIDNVRRRGGPVILIYEPPGNVLAYTLGANAYYDFRTSGAVRPYVGGGLGITSLDVNDRVIREAGAAVRAEAVGGVRFMMGEGSSGFIEARYDAYLTNVESSSLYGSDDEPLAIGTIGAYAGFKLAF